MAAVRPIGAVLLGLSLVGGSPRPATACGGCFSPTDTVTAVNSHRMAIALTPDKTMLWDQIRYSGDPADFVWVLPVPAPPDVALADPGFFPALEQRTAPVILPPICQGRASHEGCGCGGGGGDSSADSGLGIDDGDDDGVTVYQEQVVGPYETVTIGSDDPGALRAWLDDHDYRVPSAADPAIDYYVGLDSLFLVMRLAPAADVDQMQPVRVTYPGYMGSFPLRMVTVGAAGMLDLTLWVIADQRYQTWTYPTTEVADGALDWYGGGQQSNYGDLFEAAIQDAGGRAWVAEFAKPFPYIPVDDADVAIAALASPFLTRLRTHMRIDYIDRDLALAPDDGGWILQYRRVPESRCPSADGEGCAAGQWVGAPFALVVLALAAWPRRRRA
jgi:hypothetical protein